MTEWQPIETAPKDGTWILVLCPEGESKAEPFIQVARWMEFEVSREKDWAWGPLDDYFGSYRRRCEMAGDRGWIRRQGHRAAHRLLYSWPRQMTDISQTSREDRPITLKEACEYFGGHITPHALRAEARRGLLPIFRVGRRDFTTLADVREMCRAKQDRRAFGSTRPAGNGSSEMGLSASERASVLRQKLKLVSASDYISAANTARQMARTRSWRMS